MTDTNKQDLTTASVPTASVPTASVPAVPLRFGTAYHGNRMPSHAREDMAAMAAAGIDTVVHTFSHTDMCRHKTVMGEIFAISAEAGLDVWVDAWGLGGPPGDLSHFLALSPDSHMIYSDGSLVPTYACLYSPEFRAFVRSWVDAVYALGGRTVFWDEPHIPVKKTDGGVLYGCACPACRRRFEERFGRPMPEYADADTEAFGNAAVVDFISEMTAYSASLGIKNAVCVMLGSAGMSLETAGSVCKLPHVDSIGSDPYWVSKKRRIPDLDVYSFVRRGTEENLALCRGCGKEHNIWVQTYGVPRGTEEDIVTAAEAAYDGGARSIFAWGYAGSESNDYGADLPAVAWTKFTEAVARVRNLERDRLIAQARAAYTSLK